jgi:hypothetical protein
VRESIAAYESLRSWEVRCHFTQRDENIVEEEEVSSLRIISNGPKWLCDRLANERKEDGQGAEQRFDSRLASDGEFMRFVEPERKEGQICSV